MVNKDNIYFSRTKSSPCTHCFFPFSLVMHLLSHDRLHGRVLPLVFFLYSKLSILLNHLQHNVITIRELVLPEHAHKSMTDLSNEHMIL